MHLGTELKMATFIPNPFQSTIPKVAAGLSNVSIRDGVYKLCGCSLSSINMTVGYNGIASSASVTLVEDIQNGDSFTKPEIPSLLAVSLPRGGVGSPILYENGKNLNQDSFKGENVPFYFGGICTNYSVEVINVGGRTISLTITDSRELLSGIQCILSNFSLSQTIGVGQQEDTGVDNIIDVFGYFNYGLESERDQYGMEWSKIKEALENTRVRLYGMWFEFNFTGETFNDVPDFYRIDESIIDLISLVRRVSEDSGSDFIVFCRKISDTEATIEFRGIKRTRDNPLTKSELNNFINSRKSIVSNATIGKEYRPEPNSSIIIGGMQNLCYIAKPAEFISKFRGDAGPSEYTYFPPSIITRLFGGTYITRIFDKEKGLFNSKLNTVKVKSGSIFPFWGVSPDDYAYPLIEPVVELESVAFDMASTEYLLIRKRLPQVKLGIRKFKVREVAHEDTFLQGDGASDERPFAYIEDVKINMEYKMPGYIYAIPVSTEVLRIALMTNEPRIFFNIYALFYPEVAEYLGLGGIDNEALKEAYHTGKVDLKNINITKYLKPNYVSKKVSEALNQSLEKVDKEDIIYAKAILNTNTNVQIKLLGVLFKNIRKYANEYLGRKFIVCLPKSTIMNRIWDDLPVGTPTIHPQIEYRTDTVGYWPFQLEEYPELNNPPSRYSVLPDLIASENIYKETTQVKRMFCVDDGRYRAMCVVNLKPKGNINFRSDGQCNIMTHCLSTADFSPNRIDLEGQLEDDSLIGKKKIYVSCRVSKLQRRPDLALVEMPQILFDPTDARPLQLNPDFSPTADDEILTTYLGIFNYFEYHLMYDDDFRSLLQDAFQASDDDNFDFFAYKTIKEWVFNIRTSYARPFELMAYTEPVMDLHSIIIPLTSNIATYGPWYANYDQAQGNVRVEIDESLVPWNFASPQKGQDITENLNLAGQKRLERTISNIDYLDSASVSVAGFPEYGLASKLGYNSNLSSISVDFSVGGVKTHYHFTTYANRPGTFRKDEYDNIKKAIVDWREQLPSTQNENLIAQVFGDSYGVNIWRDNYKP